MQTKFPGYICNERNSVSCIHPAIALKANVEQQSAVGHSSVASVNWKKHKAMKPAIAKDTLTFVLLPQQLW